MKKILKNKIILVALVLFFIVGVTVGAATKYYEHVWTNEVMDVSWYVEFVTNDLIMIEDGYIAIGFDNANDNTIPSVRILTKDGLLKKEVTLDDLVNSRLKRIIEVEDGYLAFGMSDDDIQIIKISEDFKVDDIKTLDTSNWLDECSELFLDEDDNYYYLSVPEFVTGVEGTASLVRIKKDLSTIEEVLQADYDEAINKVIKKYSKFWDYKNYKEVSYWPVFVSEYNGGYIYGLEGRVDDTLNYLLVHIKDDKEVWVKEYENIFYRDAIELSNNRLLLAMIENGPEDFDDKAYLLMVDSEFNTLSKDDISDYISEDADIFWPEHLIRVENVGFALTGDEEYYEDETSDIPGAGSSMDRFKPDGKPSDNLPPRDGDKVPDAGTPPPKPDGEGFKPPVDTQANGEYADDYNITAKVMYFSIIHQVTTKTDGNGTVVASHTTASWGDAITYKITPNEGYVLGTVKVYDINGNPVEFEQDGNSFTMPNIDVIIDVTFTVENVETITFMSLSIIVVAIVSAVILVKARKKAKFYEV